MDDAVHVAVSDAIAGSVAGSVGAATLDALAAEGAYVASDAAHDGLEAWADADRETDTGTTDPVPPTDGPTDD